MKRAALLILLFFLFLIFHSSSFISPAFAQTKTAQVNNYPVANTNPDVPNNLHNWTQNVMVEVMLSLTCQLVGIDPTTPDKKCLGVDQKTGKIGFLSSGNPETGKIGGAIGGMNNMITMLYTPPLHTSDYFQNLAQNFGIVKPAVAQQIGTGFDGLKPLLGLWVAFRNIIYLVFVIVFVVIGLAIMLRVKIDPRTVMTIQNQIPKIIIGILLVTFSFAIAGFLVDLMWVFIHLAFGLISGISQDVAKSVAELNPASLQGKNPLGSAIGFGQLSSMVNNVAASSTEIIQKMLGIEPKLTDFFLGVGLFKDITGLIGGFLPGEFVWGAGSPVNFLIDVLSGAGSIFAGFKILQFPAVQATVLGIGGGGGWFANLPFAIPFMALVYPTLQEFLRVGLPYLIVYIIIFIALLIALFRLWFVLLMAYVNILIDVVLAPFWIVGSLVPGSPVSATGWLRDLIANLAAFPAVIFMFLLGKVFVDTFKTAANPFAPPLIGDLGNPELFSSLIGIGIILMTPNVVNMLKTTLKAPKIDTGVGKAIGAGAGVLGGTTKSTIGAGSAYLLGDPLTGKKGAEGLRQSLTRKFFG